MVKTFCGRCGEYIPHRDNFTQAVLPTYTIHRLDSVPLQKIEVNLCMDCQKDFSVWLKGGKENAST